MLLRDILKKCAFSILTFMLLVAASPSKDCTDMQAFSLLYGDIRQLAYDIISEKAFTKKMNVSLFDLNSKIGSTKVADWEYSDQVHRIITTKILELERDKLTDIEKSDLFNKALAEAYTFNLNYTAKNK